MRALRFAGHPVHPILTDFPIALLTTSVLWDVLALVTGEQRWATMAFWTLLLGVALLVPTAVTGFWDFLALPAEHPAGRTAVRHMAAVLVAGGLFTASLVVRGGAARPEGGVAVLVLVLAAVGLIALLAGGRLGGALVFRYGIGHSGPDEPT